MLQFNFDKFPYVLDFPVILQKNNVIYRGYHKDRKELTSLPTHFSCFDVADVYAKQPDRNLGCYVLQKPLHLLDLRFIIMMLKELINSPTTTINTEILKDLSISYGLCSLKKQLELLDEKNG